MTTVETNTTIGKNIFYSTNIIIYIINVYYYFCFILVNKILYSLCHEACC